MLTHIINLFLNINLTVSFVYYTWALSKRLTLHCEFKTEGRKSKRSKACHQSSVTTSHKRTGKCMLRAFLSRRLDILPTCFYVANIGRMCRTWHAFLGPQNSQGRIGTGQDWGRAVQAHSQHWHRWGMCPSTKRGTNSCGSTPNFMLHHQRIPGYGPGLCVQPVPAY